MDWRAEAIEVANRRVRELSSEKEARKAAARRAMEQTFRRNLRDILHVIVPDSVSEYADGDVIFTPHIDPVRLTMSRRCPQCGRWAIQAGPTELMGVGFILQASITEVDGNHEASWPGVPPSDVLSELSRLTAVGDLDPYWAIKVVEKVQELK